MSRRMIRPSLWLAAAVLALVFLLGQIPSAQGANLTGGTFTYMINGEEHNFPFDPVELKDGLLLPAAVFEKLGVTVERRGIGDVILRMGGQVELKVTLGRLGYTLNGEPRVAAVAPLRLAGQLFLPADLVQQMGVELTRETKLLIFTQPVRGALTLYDLNADAWNDLRTRRVIDRQVSDKKNNITLKGEFLLLNEDLIRAKQLDLTYSQRARLLGLLESHTVVLVSLANFWNGPGTIYPTELFLIDDQRRQYEVTRTVDIGEGAIEALLMPGADRRGVLLFPKLSPRAGVVSLYYVQTKETQGFFHLSQ